MEEQHQQQKEHRKIEEQEGRMLIPSSAPKT